MTASRLTIAARLSPVGVVGFALNKPQGHTSINLSTCPRFMWRLDSYLTTGYPQPASH